MCTPNELQKQLQSRHIFEGLGLTGKGLNINFKKCKYTAGLITVGRVRPHCCIFSFKAKMNLIHLIIFTTKTRSATSVAIC